MGGRGKQRKSVVLRSRRKTCIRIITTIPTSGTDSAAQREIDPACRATREIAPAARTTSEIGPEEASHTTRIPQNATPEERIRLLNWQVFLVGNGVL
jgi:hypothetical protein